MSPTVQLIFNSFLIQIAYIQSTNGSANKCLNSSKSLLSCIQQMFQLIPSLSVSLGRPIFLSGPWSVPCSLSASFPSLLSLSLSLSHTHTHTHTHRKVTKGTLHPPLTESVWRVGSLPEMLVHLYGGTFCFFVLCPFRRLSRDPLLIERPSVIYTQETAGNETE